MTDGDTLLEAVRKYPDDLTARLIYADWCEEQGEQARADFIRVQLDPAAEYQAPALLRRHRLRWDGAVLRRLNNGPLRGKVNARHGPVHKWEYRRGFIESLTVQASALLAHGEELLRIGPIQELRLVREPIPWEQLAKSPLLAGVTTLRVRGPELQSPLTVPFAQGTLPRLFPHFQIVAR